MEAEAGIPLRTAQRWVAQYQQFGLAALAREKPADTGEHRAVSVQIREAIEGLALQKPPLPIAALYRQVRQLGLKSSGRTLRATGWFIASSGGSPADLLTLAHQGTKAYGEAFELVHRREADGPSPD